MTPPTSEAAAAGVPPLSCYIRTKNEGDRIAEVVRAALACAAEVVVVDSGSTDDTVARAEAAGARVVRVPWRGNGAQKRAGEALCRNDWLLDLDADEIVSAELAAEIRALFARGAPERPVHALKLVTVPPTGEVWSTFTLAYRRKLYDRRVFRMPDHPAWDQLDLPRGTAVGRLNGALYHHSFRDFENVVAKLNRISTVRARETAPRSRVQLAARVLFALPFYFAKHLLQRGLWRAGVYGVALAGISAFGRWLRDVKMYEAMRMADPPGPRRRPAGTAPAPATDAPPPSPAPPPP